MTEYTITVDEIEFSVFRYWSSQILISEDDPINDKAYRKALTKALALLKYLDAISAFEGDAQFCTLELAFLVVEARQKGKTSVSDRAYRRAVGMMNGEDISEYRPSPKQIRKPRFGYVYLLKSDKGHYKIGRSEKPFDRMNAMGIRLPFEVEPVCVIESEDHVSLEKELHTMFADFRVNGEWFKLADEDVEYIKSLAVQA